MLKVLVLLIGCPLGIIIIWKRAKIAETVGNIDFAEQYLGPGGTYTLFLIIGILVFVGTLMYVTGALQGLLVSMFGTFFQS